MNNILILLIIAAIICCFIGNNGNKEGFYNIMPTEAIDPEYYNINNYPYNYHNWLTVGDPYGVDLNCNNVTYQEIIDWINKYNPHLIYQFVYPYDPSVDISNPIDAPRILKLLLRNVPELCKNLPVLKKCLYNQVRV